MLLGNVSASFLLNMALVDSATIEPLSAWLGRGVPIRALSMGVAWVNLAALAALWTFYLQREQPAAGLPAARVG